MGTLDVRPRACAEHDYFNRVKLGSCLRDRKPQLVTLLSPSGNLFKPELGTLHRVDGLAYLCYELHHFCAGRPISRCTYLQAWVVTAEAISDPSPPGVTQLLSDLSP